MGSGGDYADYYDVEADADPQPAATVIKERGFIEAERQGNAADAYAEIARRLKELEAERGA